METLEVDGVLINYQIIRKNNKNIYARLDKNNNIIVSAPYLASKKVLLKFIKESYFKLIKRSKKREHSIVKDGKIKILDRTYPLEEITNLNYMLTIALKDWLKENYLSICEMMNIKDVPPIIFKRVKGYLGEYNKRKYVISLNILIGHLDKECVQYVLIHELCHIKYMNHQKEFWNEVSKYCPNYIELRNRCRKEFVYYENY